MKIYKFMGKVMLITLLPFVFTVISTILVAALISILGVLSGHNTFQHCFTHLVGEPKLILLMFGAGFIASCIYVVLYE